MGLFDAIGQVLGTQNNDRANANVVGTASRDYYRPEIQPYQQGDVDQQARQNRFLDQLYQMSIGNGPSAAGQFANQASENALSNSFAMANSARGDLNPAMVFRNAMKNYMANKAANDQQASVMRNQEMLQANNLYGSNIASARGLDQNMLQFYENLGMQGDLANLGSANQAQQLNLGISEANKDRNQKLVGGIISGGAQIGAASAGR